MTQDKRAFNHWLTTPPGQALLKTEAALLAPHLAKIHGLYGLVLGDALFEACFSTARVHQLVNLPTDNIHLPIQPERLHVVFMPHTLEQSADPHQLLREVETSLRPEGYVVITGLNPRSIWPLKSRMNKHFTNINLHSLNRVLDWLHLLNMEVVVDEYALFSGLVQAHSPWLERCLGKIAFPMSSLYYVVARKRLFGMTPQRLTWQKEKNFVKKGFAKPATRGSCE